MLFAHFLVGLLISEFAYGVSSQGNNLGYYTIPFTVLAAGVFALICYLGGKKLSKGLRCFFTILLFLYYSVELVYQHIFKSYLSISQIGMGTDAISTYSTETMLGILECKWYILVLFIPVILLILERVFGIFKKVKKISIKKALIYVLILAAAHAAVVLSLNGGKGVSYSPYDTYNDTFILAQSQKYFGCLTSTRLEIRNMFFGGGTGKIVEEISGSDVSGMTEQEPEDIIYDFNISDIDFEALADLNTDERTKVLDEYFADKLPTRKNEYTGMFKDYNVITLCCESFSPYLIDEYRTPMLYKMANEGFVFNNYYGTVCDNTSNSEYALITSLLPDTSLLGKGWNTFYEYNSCTASKNNYLPLTLNNLFKEAGLSSFGFHHYYGTYYGRKDTHPNFGMEFYYMTHGLKKTEDWPTSDLELVQQSVPYYLKKDEAGNIKRFCTYYLTFSGHMYYKFDTNRIAAKNKEVSDDLPCSEAARAYVSCNQELEYALEYLVDSLETAGVLDNTLIILLPDHYPYTLGLDKLSELAGRDLSAAPFDKEFNQYKGCLLMWSSSMKEKIVVDDVMCELDILPTVLNLLGAEFDSRLLMGTDIFSDAQHIAILGDRSFVTDKIFYNALNGEVTNRTDEDVTEEYVNAVSNIVKNKFTVSTEILYTDYYRHAYGVN